MIAATSDPMIVHERTDHTSPDPTRAKFLNDLQ